jgi:LuxR family maltose regulon positive regulatory protein
MKDTIGVLVVDEDVIVREGLVKLLGEEADITVIGEAGDAEQAINQVVSLKPDVVVMDISIHNTNGIEATRGILAQAPATRIVALSIQPNKKIVDAMLKTGATGYIVKKNVVTELIQGIRAVVQGNMYLSSEITGIVFSSYIEQIPDEPAQSAGIIDLNILKSKLYPPPIVPDAISRINLLQRLEAERTRPLVLVSAPPGYGKSTLISNWLNKCDWPGVWISLDKDESDLRQFLIYFVSAVRSHFPSACHISQGIAAAGELPTVSKLVTILANELDVIEQPFILVLDDYDRIKADSDVNILIDQLLSHPPIPLHLVIIGKSDPSLSLVKLRAEGQSVEIRMQDLRFSKVETQSLLQSVTGFTPGEDVLINLEQELEGWPAGIRLVSLAVRQNEQPEKLMEHLHSGLQQTQEYLIHEVINNLPPGLRKCLLKCAILDRFSASLCNALCIEECAEESGLGGDGFIQALCDGNLFIISLDSQGEWYRYHHLFKLLLEHELSHQVAASEIVELHLRASAWYESQDLIIEAIKQAVTAGDMVVAAGIVERHYHEELNQDRWFVLGSWLEALPSGITLQYPGLLLVSASIAFYGQQFSRLATIVEQTEALLKEDVDNSDLRTELNFYRACLHFWEGSTVQSEREFEVVVQQMPEQKQKLLGEAELHLNVSRYMNGKGEHAIADLNTRIFHLGESASIHLLLLVAALAFIYCLSGSLRQLKSETRRLQELVKQSPAVNTKSYTNSWAYYMEAAADLHLLELDAALQKFSMVSENPHTYDARAVIDVQAGLALTHQLMGQAELADASVQSLIEYAYEQNYPAHVNVAHACEARIHLLQGDFTKAFNWAKSSSEPPDPFALFFWLEVPQITRVRILIVEGSTESLSIASECLKELRDLAEACCFTCQLIEISVLQCLLLEKQGFGDQALAALEEAMAIAERREWLRPFVELGQPMAELLQRFAKQKGATSFLRAVLNSIASNKVQMSADPVSLFSAENNQISYGETLTKREQMILELLSQRLQNKEIASRLFVSTETVKTHLKHLYQKLGVNNRRDASMKAEQVIAARGTVLKLVSKDS